MPKRDVETFVGKFQSGFGLVTHELIEELAVLQSTLIEIPTYQIHKEGSSIAKKG